MNRRRRTLAAVLTACFTVALLLPVAAGAQAKTLKEQLVGTWTLVSNAGKRPDGALAWGANPKGQLIFTENGRFSTITVRSDLPKFASKNRMTGTAEENKAVVQGTAAGFGTYSVSETNKSYTIRIEGSTYPEQMGTEQTRTFTIAGDELKVINPASSYGDKGHEIVYRRAR